MADVKPNLLVLGSGIVGLHSAIRLEQDYPHAQVTIMAPRNINVGEAAAAGASLFLPTPRIPGTHPDMNMEWIKSSWDYYQHLRRTIPNRLTGIYQIPMYFLTSANQTTKSDPMMGLNHVRACSKAELKLFGPKEKYIEGKCTNTIVMNPEHYLPWAMRAFKGRWIQRRIDSWNDFINEEIYDLVVNCTGLDATRLCNEINLTPLRSQILKVKAPWIKIAVLADNNNYIVPGMDDVTIGRCSQYDNQNLQVDANDSEVLWQEATSLLPNLKKAQIQCETVSLRPHPFIRIEREEIELIDGSNLSIIHHYGHGDLGFLAPGTAITASRLVGEQIQIRNQD